MYGQITKFHEALQVGVITTEDGRKLRFNKKQIVNPNCSLVGHEVDFVVSRAGPGEIILLTGTPWQVFGHARRGMRQPG